jgi:hypothetical protein
MVMSQWRINVARHGCDKVDGVMIGESSLSFRVQTVHYAGRVLHSFITIEGLNLKPNIRVSFTRDELKARLNFWRTRDDHHKRGQAYKADFRLCPCNAKIGARLRQTSF